MSMTTFELTQAKLYIFNIVYTSNAIFPTKVMTPSSFYRKIHKVLFVFDGYIAPV